MEYRKKGALWILTALAVLFFSSSALASYNPVQSILDKMQGKWYNANGSVVLDFEGNTVNGCPVVGIYNLAGGSSDFSCLLRIVESDGYRDLPLICENLRDGSYHSHIILNGDNFNSNKGTLLTRTPTVQYFESVGGIYIDMPEKEVLAKYGKPSSIRHSYEWNNLKVWEYKKLGLDLVMRHQCVWIIKIYKNGNRRFDRTGFNCTNDLYGFCSEYGFGRVPAAGGECGYAVAPGEYMWFTDYPNSIMLTDFYC